MHQACLGSFQRVFVDDAGQLETVRSLTGNVGHRLYAAFKANAHRADIFRYVEHYLRGGLYLDIKTALLEPLERIQERIVAEFKAQILDRPRGQPLRMGSRRFGGLGPAGLLLDGHRHAKGSYLPGHPAGAPPPPAYAGGFTALLRPDPIDQQDLRGFRYMAFCDELFRVIKADRYQGPVKPACRTSAQGLPSLSHPANAPSPSSAAPKTSLNGSLRWQTFKRWSNRRCTASCRRRSSGRSGGRVWRPSPRPR